MAPITTTDIAKSSSATPYQLAPSQTLRAATALLRKIQSDHTTRTASASKTDLLADADVEDAEDEVPVWVILTTKKHIVDKKRLKPGKIALPHPYLDVADESLRVCLITADPQRKYKDLVESEAFPTELGGRIKRVIGLEKLKAKYKSYESRRQLVGEYDVFLADDRIITYLPGVLGKVFYKSGSKRPIPVTLEGKRQSVDEAGNKRRKLAEGGSKVVKTELKPQDMAAEVKKALGSALVHLAPSVTTAVKVGTASMEAEQIQANTEAVVNGLVEKFVPQKWRNVRAVHVKGPETAALPIWLAEELWEQKEDVLDEPLPVKRKRRQGAIEEPDHIEVPGPDGKMRRLENPAKKRKGSDAAAPADAEAEVKQVAKKRKSEIGEDAGTKTIEKAEKAARKEALKQQKEQAKKIISVTETKKTTADGKVARKTRVKAADLM